MSNDILKFPLRCLNRVREKIASRHETWVTPENYPFSPPAQRGAMLDWVLNSEKGFAAFFRPRCGSTSVTMWFFANMGYRLRGVSVAAFRKDWVDTHREELEQGLEKNWDSLHKFVVVRDPFDRAVSSYLHTVNYPSEAQLKNLSTVLGPDVTEKNLTFRQFMHFLQQVDFDNMASIWRRQSTLSCWERGGVDDVVRLERMNEYLHSLNKKYGFRHEPTYNSVTVPEGEHVRQAGKECFADIPFSELLAYKQGAVFKSFPYYSEFYDNELRQILSDVFADDLDIYENANIR
ncbi:sulfotransferase family 2 domain-containing protein [Desulfovibrio sp. JC010]|uniref:sulfotransferase family 2 domain-containing protein n=1 Tax=Desulfovibrio sp. JC010 TaxID=2593641 RepID=UPI0013D7C4F0|nr:sulfotransferase family 2 domain-containing protein [Desulfovibrio sp. JC010]NDV27504.1 sulfotransferase family protein [Desulfovibrio sp. JC010]